MTARQVNRRLLSVDLAAEYLSVSKRTVVGLLSGDDPKLPKVRIGSRTLIDQRDLDAYIDRLKESA